MNPRLKVGMVSKVYPMRSHTVSAEGGAAAALRPEDSYENHAFDTIKGSDYLADQDVVEAFVREAPVEIIQMEHWGCPWSRDPDGKIAVPAFRRHDHVAHRASRPTRPASTCCTPSSRPRSSTSRSTATTRPS